MKKSIVLSAVVLMATLSLTSCGDKTTKGEPAPDSTAVTTSTTTTETPGDTISTTTDTVKTTKTSTDTVVEKK